MPSFQITAGKLPVGVALLSLAGELDAGGLEAMRKHFKDLFDRKSYRIVLDMTELNYISCAAVIALLGASDTAHENAGNVILANANEAIRSTLDSLGVTPLLTFAATREEAARRLA